jgi:predicted heme/steroid binding protein
LAGASFLSTTGLDDMKAFTKDELARYDGKEGRPAYVAYQGRVHDVSASFLWKTGKHQAFHKAGCDLTAALGDAPHGPELLERFPIVGMMA